ncbi:MAG TPA: glycoside hydrolase family 16 protein [Acidimicrobiales bacterium]|jgi:beta-glucanase (GH16 family)
MRKRRVGAHDSGQRMKLGLRFRGRFVAVALALLGLSGLGVGLANAGGGASGSQLPLGGLLSALLGATSTPTTLSTTTATTTPADLGLGGLLSGLLPSASATLTIGLGGLLSGLTGFTTPTTSTTTTSTSTTTTTTTTTVPSFLAPTSTISQSTTSDGKTDCGGVTLDKSDGQPWTCTFDDEFDGNSLNTSNWNVASTASSGYTSGQQACFVNTPQNVSVSGGALQLTALETSAPFTCDDPNGDFGTQYTSGSVASTFSQTYGMFEVKAAFPNATVPGLQSSLWLWPVNEDEYGATWPASGEIDFAEWYSQYNTRVIPYIHYNEATSDPNVTNNYCYVANTADYNVYGVIWTPTSLTMTMDGDTCLVDTWNPASPEVAPEPFNMPFFINLTQALGINTNAFNSNTPLPATTDIDWVRAWS